jgi:hypothetical protein
MLEVCSFAVVLGSFWRLHALKKLAKAGGDMGYSHLSLKDSHNLSVALWSATVVSSLYTLGFKFLDNSSVRQESLHETDYQCPLFCQICWVRLLCLCFG